MYRNLGGPPRRWSPCPWPAGESPPVVSKTHRRKTAAAAKAGEKLDELGRAIRRSLARRRRYGPRGT